MVRTRSRLLTCFYCGKRSDTRFDGIIRKFICKYCEAPNHLDENGEITDPPVANESIADASPLRNSQQPSSNSIFCGTCLKNQRLFVASLAQYLPGDDDDDVKFDKDYYRFRRQLEARYPQICDDCATPVGNAIQRAEYTAKTDHLRKMMEMSRRHVPAVHKRRTPLDWVNLLAWWVWWAAVAVQMGWHLKNMAKVLGQSDSGMADPDDQGVWGSGLRWLQKGVEYLPAENDLIRTSLTLNIASAWWNPKFIQVTRGFTKQLSGFRQWYLYQALLCASRYFFTGLDVAGQPRNAQLSAHAVIATMTIMVCLMASECIKTDTTPLFAPHNGTISPRQEKPARTKKEEIRTLAETLDDVLPQPGQSPARPMMNNEPTYDDYAFTPKVKTPRGYDSVDEMEWTPTASTSVPRALKDSPSNAPRAFGQAPTAEDGRPFYFRTPAAPVDPARKLRNPPNQPAIWSSAEKASVSSISPPPSRGGFGALKQPALGAGRPVKPAAGTEFSRQRFFAPREEVVEDESLADMLDRGFTLDDDQPQEQTPEVKKGWFKL